MKEQWAGGTREKPEFNQDNTRKNVHDCKQCLQLNLGFQRNMKKKLNERSRKTQSFNRKEEHVLYPYRLRFPQLNAMYKFTYVNIIQCDDEYIKGTKGINRE